MTHFIRLITNEHNNTATANFAAAVAMNTDTNLYESDNEFSYMDLAEYDTPEGSVVEIMLSEELSDDQLDKIVEQITLEDYEIQASLTEATSEKLVVIYPGRFHPFHKGHASVYKGLEQKYGATADVWIATSGKQEPGKSPFSFEEKREMIATTGIDPQVVVRTTQPYKAEEITSKYDMNNTVVLYAVSEKDMAEDPRFNFPTKGPNLKKDEAQHLAQGKSTIQMLKLLGINSCRLKEKSDLKKLSNLISYSKKNNKPVACLIENKTLALKKKYNIKKENRAGLKRSYVLETILNNIK